MQRDDQARESFLEFRRTRRPQDLSRVFDLCAQELLLVSHHLAQPGVAPEDLLQQTFLAILGSVEDYDESRPLMPWMLGILVNVSRSHHRREGRRPDPQRIGVPADLDPLEAAHAHEFARAVFEAIERLPEPQRKVLTLRLVHGLTPTEIAHALGHPVGSVKSWLHRGMERLRLLLPAGFAASLAGFLDAGTGLERARQAVLDSVARPEPLAAEPHGLPSPGAPVGTAASHSSAWIGLALLLSVLTGVVAWVVERGPQSGELAQGPAPRTEQQRDASASVGEPDLASPTSTSQEARRPADGPREALLPVRIAPGLSARFASDGAPASLAIQVEPRFGAESALRGFELRTDASGEALLSDLPPGLYEFRPDRGDPLYVQWPEEGPRIQCAIAPGTRVRGVVRGPEGRPMAHARLWLARADRPGEGAFVGTADDQGAFLLRDLPPGRLLSAVAEGFAPGTLIVVEAASGGEGGAPENTMDCVLRVGTPAAGVRGRVIDSAGRPLAGARVLVGADLPAGFGPELARIHPLQAPLTLVCDGQGAFSTDSAPTGASIRLWARAPGHALEGRLVDLKEGQRAEIEFTLRTSARWTGTAEGLAPGAGGLYLSVEAGPDSGRAVDELLPRWAVPSTYVTLGAAFDLGGLAPGMSLLRAQDDLGHNLERVCVLRDGETVQWSPVTANLGVLRGRVHCPEAPLPTGLRLRVVPQAPRAGAARRIEVADDGSFEDPGYPPGPLRVTLHAAAGGYPGALLDLGEVRADGSPLEIELPIARLPTGRIVALALDAGGRARADFSALAQDGTVIGGRGQGDGRVEWGPLPAGRYHLVLPTPGGIEALHGPVELAPGGLLDVGPLLVQECGRLRVELELGERPAAGDLRASVISSDGTVMLGFNRFVEGACEISVLAAGRHRLSIHEGSVLLAQEWVDVPAGGAVTRRVDARPRPLARVLVRGARVFAQSHLLLRVWPSGGGEDRLLLARAPAGTAGEVCLELELDPGSYGLEVHVDGGASARTTMESGSDGALPQAVIELP